MVGEWQPDAGTRRTGRQIRIADRPGLSPRTRIGRAAARAEHAPLRSIAAATTRSGSADHDRHRASPRSPGPPDGTRPRASRCSATSSADADAWRDLAALVGPSRPGCVPGALRRADRAALDAGSAGGVAATRWCSRELARRRRPRRSVPRTDDVGPRCWRWSSSRGRDRSRPDARARRLRRRRSTTAQLVAMAGERLRLPGCCEISAVCTHPDHRAVAGSRRAHRARARGASCDVRRHAVPRTTRPTTTRAPGLRVARLRVPTERRARRVRRR